MNSNALNLIREVLYLICVSFSLGITMVALPKRHLTKPIIHHGLRLFGLATFVIIQRVWVYDISIIEVLIVGESFYVLFSLIALLIKPEQKQQEAWSVFSFLMFLSLSITLVIKPQWLPLFTLDLKWLAFAHLCLLLIYMGVLYSQHAPSRDLTPWAMALVGSLIVVFMFNVDGLFFLAAFQLGFFLTFLKLVYDAVEEDRRVEMEKIQAIQKDFNHAVRKEVNHRLFYVELSKEKMAKLNKTDDLTGALTKKAVIHFIDHHIDNKKTKTFSVLMFDIDKFKTINDTMGHIVGDKCLKTLASIAKENIREHDEFGRYGGDEFIIVLPDADLSTAHTVAERFRQNIDKTNDPHFTVSIGIANYPKDGKTHKELIHEADESLYVSKANGRNRVSYRGMQAGPKA